MQKLLANGRYLILIAVLCSCLAAAAIIVYNALLLICTLVGLVLHPDLSTLAGRQLTLVCIELIDAFLLGTAFYIVALGLYELFLNRRIATPNWLHVRSLDDLKTRLLAVTILVLSVFFLEQVINWDRKSDILSLGIAEALVITAITLAIRLQMMRPPGEPGVRPGAGEEPEQEEL